MGVYADAFGGPPWNENTVCTDCQEFYGQEYEISTPCPCCGELLLAAYPPEQTMDYILSEVGQEGAFSQVIRDEQGEVCAFAWGYGFESPEDLADAKYNIDEMRNTTQYALTASGVNGPLFYFSECGVRSDKRGSRLSSQLANNLDAYATENNLPMVMRTTWQSPMMAIAKSLGMTQLLGPEVVVDKVQRQILQTGKMTNDTCDLENSNRVLFAKLPN